MAYVPDIFLKIYKPTTCIRICLSSWVDSTLNSTFYIPCYTTGVSGTEIQSLLKEQKYIKCENSKIFITFKGLWELHQCAEKPKRMMLK